MPLNTARPAVLASALLGLVSLALATVASTAGATRGDAAGQTVAITDNEFVPNHIGVHPGESVLWINTDDGEHSVESTSGPEAFGTGEEALKKGQTYKFTFTKPGVYHFVASLHHNVSGRGTVTVGEGARTTTSDEDEQPNGGVLAPLLPH